jgi:hypothetical protein
MKKTAREINALECMLVLSHADTVFGSTLKMKYNKKKKQREWHLDDKVYMDDSTYNYQDEDGFHLLWHLKSQSGKSTMDLARILKGNIDLFVSNWNVRGSGSQYDPKKGYLPGTGFKVTQQYFFRKGDSRTTNVSYGGLKDYISDNKAALAQYKIEFGASNPANKIIEDWKAIIRVIEIYNH